MNFKSRGCGCASGVTLIELLAVIGIIMVLASLLLGPVHRAYARAKAMDWESKGTFDKATEQLRKFHLNLKQYPALTPKQLRQMKVIDDEVLAFLKFGFVKFFPFSSESPPQSLIIRFAPSKQYAYDLYKSNLVADPNDP
jgi:type II secretory pathway pseudopilin PulG